jgi:hypothetical protein
MRALEEIGIIATLQNLKHPRQGSRIDAPASTITY